MAGISLATALSAGGTAISALGSIKQGAAAKAAANFQAAQLEQRAKAERAVAQREGIERKREIKLAESRARALGAAGGVATTSPTLSNILGGLDFEADYAKDVALASGEERAIGSQMGAAAAKLEGKQAYQAGLYGAAGSLAQFGMSSSGASLFDKYGGGSKTLPWQTKGNVRPAWMGGGKY